jgi:hypothetical protein
VRKSSVEAFNLQVKHVNIARPAYLIVHGDLVRHARLGINCVYDVTPHQRVTVSGFKARLRAANSGSAPVLLRRSLAGTAAGRAFE